MNMIIKTVSGAVVDYIIDSLSGNFGWQPISSIDPDIVSRFMTVYLADSKHKLYDIMLSDNCSVEAKSNYITLRYREHLATLDAKDFEQVVIG